MKTKLITLLFAVAASVGTMFPAITIRLNSQSCSEWSTVRLYYWGYEENDELYGLKWPGIEVAKDADGWFSYTFAESVSKANIIWTNGTDQTVDIEDVSESTCYSLNSTSGRSITVSIVDCSTIIITSNPVKIGDLYYNLEGTNQTAEVTYQYKYSSSNYSGLTTATIPETVAYNSTTYSVTSIGDSAFYWCSGLTSVTIPNSVTSIEELAFLGCSGLTSITIPNSITSIGRYAFFGCTGLTAPVYNANCFAYLPISYSGAYAIPDGIKQVSSGAFSSCTGLTSVNIPNSVTNIGHSTFSECSSLTSVTIGNRVTNIGDWAFQYCSGLTSVTIGNSVTSIGDYAFYRCTGLTSVTIPNSVISIGWAAFCECTGLKSVTIGNSVTTIESNTFEGCLGLNAIYVPCSSLEVYQNAAGWAAYAYIIKYVPYPTYQIIKVAENGYINATSTDGYTICDEQHPITCTAIPNRGCYFVRWADGNSDNPRTIELTQDTTMEAIFDYLLIGKCGKDSVLVWKLEPKSMALEITGKGALSENYTYGTFIESLSIGNEVTTIGYEAFEKFRNLKNIVLGASLKVLEEQAFKGCTAVRTITCYSQRPPTVNNRALDGLDYSTIVYVPANYLNTYKMHDAWGLYDVRPLGATNVETTEVEVTPSETTAEVVWPVVSGAVTYELVIKDKNGNVICTLVFNVQGQLTTIAFNAPARNNAPQQTESTGFSFTVTGLESGTRYDLTMTAKDGNDTTLQEKTMSFKTTGDQAIDEISTVNSQLSTKIVRDGQLFILRDGEIYNAQGARVE